MSVDVTSAWQAGLGAEYAAVFGYSVLGPRLGDSIQSALAGRDQDAHRSLAATVQAQMRAASIAPAEPAADYPLPYPVDGELAACQLALRLETACASAWRYLLAVAAAVPAGTASTTQPPGPGGAGLVALRTAALSALTDSAVRAVPWRTLITPARPTEAFPGI